MFTESLQVMSVDDLSLGTFIVPVFRHIRGYFRTSRCGLDFDLQLWFSCDSY